MQPVAKVMKLHWKCGLILPLQINLVQREFCLYLGTPTVVMQPWVRDLVKARPEPYLILVSELPLLMSMVPLQPLRLLVH